MHENQGYFNSCGLMDVSVFEITCFGSRPDTKRLNHPRQPNNHTKQRPIYAFHKTFSRLRALIISFPRGIITIVGEESARNWDGTALNV